MKIGAFRSKSTSSGHSGGGVIGQTADVLFPITELCNPDITRTTCEYLLYRFDILLFRSLLDRYLFYSEAKHVARSDRNLATRALQQAS